MATFTRQGSVSRTLLAAVGSLAIVGVLGACSSQLSKDAAVVPARSGGATKSLPICSAEVLKDPQAYINKDTANREDLKQVTIAASGRPLTSDTFAMEAIARFDVALQSERDPEQPGGSAANVRTIDKVLGVAQWNSLIRREIVGKGPAGG
jgi:hypothetical protein